MSLHSQAPALDRAITLMEVLQKRSPLNLEELAQETGSPKSSLLRLLETLQVRGWVKKDSTKRYHSKVKISPLKETLDWEGVREKELISLGQKLGLTVEWYDIKNKAAVITWRHEPEGTFLRVHARVGHTRGVDGEIDAVSQVLLKTTNLKAGPEIWTYKEGERVPLSKKEFNRMLDREGPSTGSDVEYNDNGIRRLASAVKDEAGKLVGIIALAEGFTPKVDQLRKKRIEELEGCSEILQNFLRDNP